MNRASSILLAVIAALCQHWRKTPLRLWRQQR
jgi:hypothetical protein